MWALFPLLALVALVAAGCGGDSDGDSASPPAVTDSAAPEDAAKRPLASAIEGTTLDGEKTSLAALRGKHVFVNVWSSW